ncbi:MAG: hypothetical protein D6737_01615 [Chloroflexi bacterium]|nr:MAG: hypothetical protein CUN54_04920 [Phototrophicales bacterium]RMF82495.1 MAG: hypothetical protein D6737_01615 [Chloroflexota bacterium]
MNFTTRFRIILVLAAMMTLFGATQIVGAQDNDGTDTSAAAQDFDHEVIVELCRVLAGDNQAAFERCLRIYRDRLEDLYDRVEDIRDRREDVRDRYEDLLDRREDIRDRLEDIRDERDGDNGPRDELEDVYDELEDIHDEREDRRDAREDRRDRIEDCRDRIEDFRDNGVPFPEECRRLMPPNRQQ